MQFNIFTKNYWLIARAKFRLFNYKHFYSFGNTWRVLFALVWGTALMLLVIIPHYIFEWLYNFIDDNMPVFIKINDNPEWLKMTPKEKRDKLLSFKDWK